jgi:hypothetical protein
MPSSRNLHPVARPKNQQQPSRDSGVSAPTGYRWHASTPPPGPPARHLRRRRLRPPRSPRAAPAARAARPPGDESRRPDGAPSSARGADIPGPRPPPRDRPLLPLPRLPAAPLSVFGRPGGEASSAASDLVRRADKATTGQRIEGREIRGGGGGLGPWRGG